jgi:hypothetical protein
MRPSHPAQPLSQVLGVDGLPLLGGHAGGAEGIGTFDGKLANGPHIREEQERTRQRLRDLRQRGQGTPPATPAS